MMTIAVNSIFTAAQGVRVKAPAQGWHAVAGGIRQIPPAREVLFDPYHCYRVSAMNNSGKRSGKRSCLSITE
jgi:hypothetical protein